MPKPSRSRRRYSDAFRAGAMACLDANGGTVERTARELDIPPATLEGWAKGRSNPVPPELRDQKRRDLAGTLEDFATRLCGVDLGRLEALNLRDVGVALGITVDKLLVVRNTLTQRDRAEDAAPKEDYTLLTRDELHALCELHRKSRGEPPVLMASDLDHPCIVDPDHPDGGYWPNGEPPEVPIDDPPPRLPEGRARTHPGSGDMTWERGVEPPDGTGNSFGRRPSIRFRKARPVKTLFGSTQPSPWPGSSPGCVGWPARK